MVSNSIVRAHCAPVNAGFSPTSPRNAAEVPQLLLTVPQAAQSMVLCERTVRDLISRGELKPVRIGKKCVRLPVTELEAFIARHVG